MAGKGDRFRPVNREKWEAGWDAIDWNKMKKKGKKPEGFAVAHPVTKTKTKEGKNERSDITRQRR